MKKLFIALALLLPMSWAGATWFTASQTESVFDLAITHSNEKISENMPFVKIEKRSFERGFISSQAKSTLGLDQEILKSEAPVMVNLNHTIYHGPVMMTPNGIKSGSSYILTTLDQESLSPEAAEIVKTIFAGEEPFKLGMHTGVGNKVDVDVNVAPLQLDSSKLDLASEMPDGEMFLLNMDGVSGLFSTNAESTWLKGTIDLGALKIIAKKADEDINLQMDASVTEMDYDEIYKGAMLTGSSGINVPAFSMSKGEETVSIKGLSMQSSIDDHNGNLEAVAVIDVENLLVKADHMPTGFPESSLHLGFAVRGLERGAVINLIDASQALNRLPDSTLKADVNNQAVEDMMKAAGNYFEALGNLVIQGTESNNVIRISGDKGSSELLLDITYTDAKKLFDLATVKDLIMALQAELKVNVDKNILSDLPVEENMQITMGFVKDKGNAYETITVLNAGELRVNGEPVPVLDMLGPMADQPLPWQMMQGLLQ